MTNTTSRATPEQLDDVVAAVASWQREEGPVQVHPGDLGWNPTMGAGKLAAETLVWRQDGRIVAVGMGDSDVVRMATSPDVDEDETLATRIVEDLSVPSRGLLDEPCQQLEARFGSALRRRLTDTGWTADEAWTPLRRELSSSVEAHGLRIETITGVDTDPEIIRDRIAVHRAAFPNSTLTTERWRAMATSPAYRAARCLVAYDTDGVAVAATTVWSAGTGRPGLIEPLGAHRDHRGKGHGRAITLAAARALQEMGASSVTVCTRSANEIGVGAYVSAGFTRLPGVPDFRRPPTQ